MTSHSAVEERLSWLLLFARAKRSNSLLRSRSESLAFKLLLSRFMLWPLPWSHVSWLSFLMSVSCRSKFKCRGRIKSFRAPAYAPDALRAPGPLRRRDFSTRPSCDAAGAGAVASRRQPAHRGEAVLRLFPVRPCLVEKRRASLHAALRAFSRRLRRCGRGP